MSAFWVRSLNGDYVNLDFAALVRIAPRGRTSEGSDDAWADDWADWQVTVGWDRDVSDASCSLFEGTRDECRRFTNDLLASANAAPLRFASVKGVQE